MNKLREKSEIWFAVINIIVYVVLVGNADSISASMGMQGCITLPICIVMLVIYLMFMKKNGLMEYYGLCRGSFDWKKWLFFLPMIVAAMVNFQGGIAMEFPILETVILILVKALAGVLEEIIFRGYLFKAISKSSVKRAVIISSVTFGIGHIVNLLYGKEVFDTLIQIVYAVAIGFMLTVVFQKSGSIFPCILFHAFINGTSVLGAATKYRLVFCLLLTVICAAYAGYLYRVVPDRNGGNDEGNHS